MAQKVKGIQLGPFFAGEVELRAVAGGQQGGAQHLGVGQQAVQDLLLAAFGKAKVLPGIQIRRGMVDTSHRKIHDLSTSILFTNIHTTKKLWQKARQSRPPGGLANAHSLFPRKK